MYTLIFINITEKTKSLENKLRHLAETSLKENNKPPGPTWTYFFRGTAAHIELLNFMPYQIVHSDETAPQRFYQIIFIHSLPDCVEENILNLRRKS